ncbi:nucleotidyltransferase domain-containing protein [Clostridium weizhouense]|uniref:Nucleotidyltransferase domain-containing protein n=1 Tax=Clostridium weizhouense TaxID=2859781 RepID=A0ABS7APC0_9CLOT|nr:nucleotidyltransferase domain-containing protein [Clostridium weizhouense]MBW6409350.1 nucleotidyltransferase domain-containing protein [Clostridium weizhouense]
MKLLSDLKINNIDNLISLAVFGSYGTKYWINGKSDIDILVLMEKRQDIMDEFDLEEILEPILESYFKYDKIHLTFINMRDYDSIFARQYIDSDDKLIVNDFKEIDFRLYINKYLRENDWLIKKIKKDNKLMEEAHGSSIL